MVIFQGTHPVRSYTHLPRWIRSGRMALLVILFIGCALRVAWMLAETPVISMEGTEHVRMAESLLRGDGLRGNFDGPELMYTPLLSVLIAGAMLVIPDGETAAHVVVLLFGTALIAAIFAVASHLYGTRTAYLCAGLATFHPLFIKLSGLVFTESVYLTLLVAAIYFGLRSMELVRCRDFIMTGACFGLAYLARPEAFVYPVVLSVVFCAAALVRKKVSRGVIASAMMLAAFCVVAAPNVWYLYQHTGSPRLEGKWNINFTMAENLRTGANDAEARYGIAENLAIKGPLLDPAEFANFTPYPHTLFDKVRSLLFMANYNKWYVYDNLFSPSTGSPILLVLVVLGLFCSPWNTWRLARESILLVIAGSIVALALTGPGTYFRFLFPVMPLAILWSGKGLEELRSWASRLSAIPLRWVPTGLQVGAALSLFAFAEFGSLSESTFVAPRAGYSLAERDAGIWLSNYRAGAKRIAARFTMVTFYARGTLVQLPYADSDLTLRYLKARKPDFVVLESATAKSFPTLLEWLMHGIPDGRARPIYDEMNASGDRIVIYEWADS